MVKNNLTAVIKVALINFKSFLYNNIKTITNSCSGPVHPFPIPIIQPITLVVAVVRYNIIKCLGIAFSLALLYLSHFVREVSGL